MNVITPGATHDFNLIVRETAAAVYSMFLFEFISAGGQLEYSIPTAIYHSDKDSPYLFQVPVTFIEGEKRSFSVYAFPYDIPAGLAAKLITLETSPVGDSMVSLKQACETLSPVPTFELIYKGLVFCTAETVYFPYNPIEGEYETIEKAATIYKTR